MMSDWQDKSDFEINKAVAEALGFTVKVSSWSLAAKKESMPYSEFLKGDVYYIDTPSKNIDLPDYCSNPQDAWPVILKCEIDILSPSTNATENWFAGFFDPHSIAVAEDIKIYDKNPLRAAMIVYLEMNGVKPNE